MTLARSFYTSAVATEHWLGIRWPRAIWQAVLEQAIKDVVDGPAAFELRNLSLADQHALACAMRAAAEHWIEDDTNEPRRFVWVCEQLGLDPAAVRRSIEERTRA